MSKTEFLAGVRGARTELLEIIGRSDERTLAIATVPGMDWTAKDVLSHLIGYDQAILQAAKDVREGRPFSWPWASSTFDVVNAGTVGARRSRPFTAVLGELETTRAALLRELEGWPNDRGPFGPDSWDVNASEISWLTPHEREHAEMLAKL